MGVSRFVGALSAVLVAGMAHVSAAQTKPTAPADAAVERGRAAYVRGLELAKQEEWGDALASFQEAAAARDAPLVEYSIGYCERALGRYVASRRTLQAVIANPAGLDPTQIDDTKGYLTEFDKLIVRVAVQLDPPNAVLTVDGRPFVEGDGTDAYLAGIAPAGVGVPMGKSAFTVFMDPGLHLFRAVREGHQDAVVSKSYRPGESATLDLHLDVLPATVAIRSEPAAGIVRVDSREVGLAPIEFQRPAGQYKLEVLLNDYETYEATLDLQPGQRSDLTARLNPHHDPITKKWWFWTGAAAVVAGGVVATYFLTRPAPQPPPYDGGNTGWVVQAQGVRW